jgi:hypothetical protein
MGWNNPKPTYGSENNPTTAGSEGSAYAKSTPGGGVVWVEAAGDIVIDGIVTADGEHYDQNNSGTGASVRFVSSSTTCS